jgi:hypothetical protein
VRGVKVSHNAVWLFLRHEGLRFKKTLLALGRGRSDVARRRRRWQCGRPASILGAWCSSTKPRSRPTWPRCADGNRRYFCLVTTSNPPNATITSSMQVMLPL